MLKAPVQNYGTPKKGTPQGGILSPLLSNVVLNDLDWWLANQWEEFKTRHPYKNKRSIYSALKASQLKEMHLIRYADDFKIFTNSPKVAIKIYHAVKGYIENHLKLNISKEKSKITNLRKNYSEFLGFELKVEKQRNNQYMSISRLSRKSKQRIKEEIRKKVKAIQKHPTTQNIIKYNLFVRGVHNYYRKVTRVNLDFSDIYYSCLPVHINRLKNIGKYEIPRSPPEIFSRMYSTSRKLFNIKGILLYPLPSVQWKKAQYFNPKVINFTKEGREFRTKSIKPSVTAELNKMSIQYSINETIEFLDNRLSRYSMQNGKCAITGQFLHAEEVHCHHLIPRSIGRSDSFDNLTIIHVWAHKLVHATRRETIDKYLNLLQVNTKQLEKLNKYREKCNLELIH